MMAALSNDVARLGGVFPIANRAKPCVSHVDVDYASIKCSSYFKSPQRGYVCIRSDLSPVHRFHVGIRVYFAAATCSPILVLCCHNYR